MFDEGLANVELIIMFKGVRGVGIADGKGER